MKLFKINFHFNHFLPYEAMFILKLLPLKFEPFAFNPS